MLAYNANLPSPHVSSDKEEKWLENHCCTIGESPAPRLSLSARLILNVDIGLRGFRPDKGSVGLRFMTEVVYMVVVHRESDGSPSQYRNWL